jgi:hypothetical protein
MHPGPMNRGIEIASDVADGTRSLILDQVANGLAVRMAVLYLLAGGSVGNDNMPLPVKTEVPAATNANAGVIATRSIPAQELESIAVGKLRRKDDEKG